MIVLRAAGALETFSSPSLFADGLTTLTATNQERRTMDLSLAEHQLNTFLDRRARAVPEDRPGQAAANAEEDRERARETRRTHTVQIINARAWAEYFGGLALAAHDQAARYAEKRDQACDLVRELEAGGRMGA